jgi:translocation and assembly module TamB
MRPWVKRAAWAGTGLMGLVIILIGGLWAGGNTDAGRALIERLTYRLTGGYVTLTRLGGAFPARLTLDRLTLTDSHGVWLTANQVSVDWSPSALISRRIRIDRLQAAQVTMPRAPVSSGSRSGGSVSIPPIDVGRFDLPQVELGAPLAGTAATLALTGKLQLRSLTDAQADVEAHRRDGAGDYVLHLLMDPRRVDASLRLHEPASGPLENLLSLPGLGALSANIVVQGPRNAERVDARVDAGNAHGQVRGSIDLLHASADLNYSLEAAALAPRPDIAWARLALAGDWHGPWMTPRADGTLQIDDLRLGEGSRIMQLRATLSAGLGSLGVKAVVNGMSIPGPEPMLFAADPLSIDASIALNQAARPVELKAVHHLFILQAHGDTVASILGDRPATLELRLPDLAPLAKLAAQDIEGSAALKGDLNLGTHETALNVSADLNLTAGTSPWVRLMGAHPALGLIAALAGDHITLQNLRVAANGTTLSANGAATRLPDAAAFKDSLKDLQVRWQLDATDLAAVSADVAGSLRASGQLAGSLNALQVDADASAQVSVRGSAMGGVQATVHARGLPRSPSGTIQAHGMLDGAPLNVDAALDRLGDRDYRLVVRQADWKSAHLEGDATTDADFSGSRGKLRLSVGALGDFDRVLGSTIAGSLSGNLAFTPVAGRIHAELTLDGTQLVLGPVAGDVHLSAQGPADAVAVQLKAQLPSLYGTPATATGAATLDVDARELRIANIAFDYRGQTLHTLAPSRLTFADGWVLDDLKLGLGSAEFALRGQLLPTMDLHASLSHLGPDVVNGFLPQLLAGGDIEASADLQGTPGSPTGSLQLAATSLTFADNAATGLPPVNIHAKAQLAGDAAALSATLSAGAASQASASGKVPLNARGALDLKVGGKLDLGLANPLLEARGLRAAGALTLNATVTGSSDDPVVGGDIILTDGSARDYVHGVNLTDITADVSGTQGGLEIKSFKAKATTGTVTLSGSLGLLQHGMPVNLTLTAKNAQAVSSSIVTANVDSELHLEGLLLEHLDATGTIGINRAIIGIPDSLPPDIAVLDVRRRGQAAPPPNLTQRVVDLHIVIHAPREVLVQGRGLDAELAGDITVSGTADQPQVGGGFNLVRGSFTISGNKLTLTQPGRVGFDGTGLKKKLDPTLDFTAQTSVSDDTITLTIGGLADAPQFTLTDSQGLPQDQIMSLLLFSQPAAQLSALQVAEVGAALATLTGVGGGGSNPLTKLQKTLGLDRLTVGANTTTSATGAPETSGAAIAAGRYVSKRVYVEARQTTTGTSQVQVDIDLTKHLKLQTRLGDGTATTTQGTTPENDPGSSIGLSYQFEY